MHGIGENESISSGVLKEGDGGPFVRQDELSTQGVYVKALWLTMASRREGGCAISCRKDWNLQLDKLRAG
jgi:hypothetical protein